MAKCNPITSLIFHNSSIFFVLFLVCHLFGPSTLAYYGGGGGPSNSGASTYDYSTTMSNHHESEVTAQIVPLTQGLAGERYDINTSEITFPCYQIRG